MEAVLGPLHRVPWDALGEGRCFERREFWQCWGRERKRLSQGEGSPREGLTSSILIHHAQPLCLVLSLEGIEVQDAKGKKGKREEMY